MKHLVVMTTAWIVLSVIPILGDEASSNPTVEFHNGSVVRYATVEEAKALLGTADDWVKAFGPFDRAMRMQSQEPVTEEAFLAFAAGEAREWDADEIAKMTEVVATVAEKLTALDLELDLPETILLIQTTGVEEANASGYTRSRAIIVPEKQMKIAAEKLQAFVLHELFHIMTRHNPDIRVPLYDVVGYKPCDEIEYPKALMPRKITNPDAFHFNTYIELVASDEPVLVMPVTLSKSDTYTGGALFDNVSIEFLRLDPETKAAAYTDGKPTLYSMGELGGYMEKIGMNTMYIIHAEEIMADNFYMAVLGQRDVPNPEILDAVIEILSSKE